MAATVPTTIVYTYKVSSFTTTTGFANPDFAFNAYFLDENDTSVDIEGSIVKSTKGAVLSFTGTFRATFNVPFGPPVQAGPPDHLQLATDVSQMPDYELSSTNFGLLVNDTDAGGPYGDPSGRVLFYIKTDPSDGGLTSLYAYGEDLKTKQFGYFVAAQGFTTFKEVSSRQVPGLPVPLPTLPFPSVPLPASAPMFGAGIVILGAAGYAARRKKTVAPT